MRAILKLIICLLAFAQTASAVVGSINGFEEGNLDSCLFTGTTQSVQNSTVITGNFSLRVNPTTTATGYCQVGTQSTGSGQLSTFSGTDSYIGFHFRYATKPASASEEMLSARRSGAQKMQVRLNSSGNLEVYDNTNTLAATGTRVLDANTTYWIQAYVGTGSPSNAIVLINGAVDISVSGDFSLINTEGWSFGKRTNQNSNTIDFFYDNYVRSDTSFAEIPVTYITAIAPSANGTTAQWTAGTNSSNYLEVDETPPDDDTTYIKSTVAVSQLHLVALQDTGTVGISGSIVAVRAYARTREDTTGTSSGHLRMKSGGTNSDTTTGQDVATTYGVFFLYKNTDPNTSVAWTLAGVDALEVGVLEDNAIAIRCTAIVVSVAWQPRRGSLGLLGVG